MKKGEWKCYYFVTSNEQFFQLYCGKNKLHVDDDDVHIVLDQHATLDFYSASSLKQQSTCHATQTHYSNLSQPVFALTYSLDQQRPNKENLD
jgi:hypothetical protein